MRLSLRVRLRVRLRRVHKALIHPIDDTHVCKKEENFRMQLHSLLLIELYWYSNAGTDL